MDDDPTGLLAEAIQRAAVAGGLRLWARQDPRTEPGLSRAADKHSAAAADLMAEWLADLGVVRPAMPIPLYSGG